VSRLVLQVLSVPGALLPHDNISPLPSLPRRLDPIADSDDSADGNTQQENDDNAGADGRTSVFAVVGFATAAFAIF
jgi:hypothetical protein